MAKFICPGSPSMSVMVDAVKRVVLRFNDGILETENEAYAEALRNRKVFPGVYEDGETPTPPAEADEAEFGTEDDGTGAGKRPTLKIGKGQNKRSVPLGK